MTDMVEVKHFTTPAALKRMAARMLLEFTTDELWNVLTGEFELVFDDATVLRTNARQTLYSSYAWDFHRKFPLTPLLPKHHVANVMGKRRLDSDTHLRLLGKCMWEVHDTYQALQARGQTVPALAVDRDQLSEMIYRTMNRMYNDLSYRCEEYVVSRDILDYVQVLDHPKIKAAKEEFVEFAEQNFGYEATQKKITETYRVIHATLESDSALDHNPLALSVRSKLSKLDSILQCIGPRGYLTDTDSHIFKNVCITRGYVEGIRRFVDSMVESRSASKSLTFSKAPLQQAEYFSRRLQLMSQIVRNLHHGDCGSKQYLKWEVRGQQYDREGKPTSDGDLKKLAGKYYRDEHGGLKEIHASDTHLIGRVLRLRSVLYCEHPDPYGICSTCFGALSLSVPENTNIGHMCCTSMTQKSSQSVLSVKHMDASASVEGIELGQDEQMYLRVGDDQNSYGLAWRLKDPAFKVQLVIPASRAARLTDIHVESDVRKLSTSRVSELEFVKVVVTTQREHGGYSIDDPTLVVSRERRMASLTWDALAYIREVGLETDESGNFMVDMSKWDWDKSVLELPYMHFNMSDHSREIAELLESSVEELQTRAAAGVEPEPMLMRFYDVVNDKLTVNLAVLEVTLYATMIRSAENHDYALPKPWTTRGFGVMSLSMTFRSAAPAMAYEGHREFIINPYSYVVRNRPDHPMDAVVMPAEVLRYLPPRVVPLTPSKREYETVMNYKK